MPRSPASEDFDDRRTLVAPRPGASRPPPTPRAPRMARGTARPEAGFDPSKTVVSPPPTDMPRPPEPPRKLPAFLPAETVVPVASYRGGSRGVGRDEARDEA